eukprot:s3257_g7.t1
MSPVASSSRVSRITACTRRIRCGAPCIDTYDQTNVSENLKATSFCDIVRSSLGDMSWYAGKPPDWEVCWDFANRHKQGSTWNGGTGPYSEVVEPSPESYQPWADAQPWFPPPQPQFWPDPTWEYMQLLQMQASAARSSTMPRPVQETDSVALPPSLEKRLQELKSNKAAKPAAPPPPDREFEGSLKSLSDRHGYGFIACQDVHRIYGRDTYVPKDLVPEDIKVLDRVIFKIGLSKKGHPQVTQIRRAPIAPDSPES